VCSPDLDPILGSRVGAQQASVAGPEGELRGRVPNPDCLMPRTGATRARRRRWDRSACG